MSDATTHDPDDELTAVADRLRAERAVPTPAIRARTSARLAEALLRRALRPRALALLSAGTVGLVLAALLAARPL